MELLVRKDASHKHDKHGHKNSKEPSKVPVWARRQSGMDALFASTALGQEMRKPLLARHDPAMEERRAAVCGDAVELMTQFQQTALLVHAATHGRFFDESPVDARCWNLYVSAMYWQRKSETCIKLLILLSLFETPLWCNQSHYWSYRGAEERCRVEGKAEGSQLIISGLPLIPIGAGVLLELCLLGIVARHVQQYLRLMQRVLCLPSADMLRQFHWEVLSVSVALLDVALFAWTHSAHEEGIRFRIAPYARFCLAAVLIQRVRSVLGTFLGILGEMIQIGIFLIGSIIIFAWIAALIFQDYRDASGQDIVNRFGDPVSSGLDTPSHAIYTAFLTVTTANLPDALVFAYTYNRLFIALWLPFILLTCGVFVQVILAVVYNTYSERLGSGIKQLLRNRSRAVNTAFTLMAQTRLDDEEPLLHLDDFEELMASYRLLEPIDADLCSIIFEALDDDNSGNLNEDEFQEFCDIIIYDYRLIHRDSRWLERVPEWFRKLMYNGDPSRDYSYGVRYHGSFVDNLMNTILSTNCLFMVVESCFDFTGTEPDSFQWIDLVFSFAYLGEVAAKLAIWSVEEYWSYGDNQFDFGSSIVLGGSGCLFLMGYVNHDTLRYVNLLRILRLLKALCSIPTFRSLFLTLTNMVGTCSDVLLMNFLVLYVWSALGLQLFGGEFYAANPRFAANNVTFTDDGTPDLDFFSNKYQVFNFNDMFLGLVTLFFFMLSGWIDPIAVICLSLDEKLSASWLLTSVYFLGFYLASTLLAFNVFTAFSIDVYCQLKLIYADRYEEEKKEEEGKDQGESASKSPEKDPGNDDPEPAALSNSPCGEDVCEPGVLLLQGIPSAWQDLQLRVAFAAFGGLLEIRPEGVDASGTWTARVRLREPQRAGRAVAFFDQEDVGDDVLLPRCRLACQRLDGGDTDSTKSSSSSSSSSQDDTGEDALMRNLADIMEPLWEKGIVLHVHTSAEVERLKVYRNLFEDQINEED